MRKSSIYILLVLVLSGCNFKKTKDPLSQFNEMVNIEGDKITINGKLYNPFNLIYLDSTLIMADPTQDKFLKIYNLKTKKLYKSLKRGKGPNEVIMAYQLEKNPKQNTFQVYDMQRDILFSFNLDSVLLTERTIPIDKVKFDVNSFFRIIKAQDSLYIGTGIIENGRYGIINQKGKLVKAIINYPKDPAHPNAKFDLLGMAYQSDITIKPKGDKFASGTLHGGVFEIFDIENKDIKKKKSSIFFLPQYVEERNNEVQSVAAANLPESLNGFLQLRSTNKYIYLLYSGRSYKEYKNKSFYSENILVYDWNGNPVKRFKLNKDAVAFDVSSDNKQIYTIHHNPEPEIIRFNIKLD